MVNTKTYSTKRRSVVNEFSKLVAKRLKDSQVTHAQLAEKTNLSRQYIYRILKGDQNPTLAVAEKIALALDLRISVSESN